MKDTILKVPVQAQYSANMARYSLYVLFERCVPSIFDGLKPVQRRILYAMWHDIHCTDFSSKRKCAKTVGEVIGSYSPHSQDSTYGAFKPMTNWFEAKTPLITYQGNSGTIQGDPQAAMRYTESYLSKFSMEAVFADLIESKNVVDWNKTFDNYTVEPDALPVKVPLLLINGTFGIAIGRRIEVPPHSLNDVVDATVALLRDPSVNITLIPDPCQKCEIVDTDWAHISNLGFGYFTERGIVEICKDKKTDVTYLNIRSCPDLIWANTVVEHIENLIKEGKLIQISDIQDHSSNDQLDIRIFLKHGADPEYVRQMLYKNTPLQDNKRVNMEVIIDNEVKRVSYKEYLQYFITFRKNVKFRLYNARLQKVNTRLHTIEIFIKILESGEVEEIVHKIRSQNHAEEAKLIEWLMKLLKITDVQAKYILNIEIKRLSKYNLSKYLEEQKTLRALVTEYTNMIAHPELIDREIEKELLDIKAKYGKPRQSIIISEGSANNIPEGIFNTIVYENATIKKMPVTEPIRAIRGIYPQFVINGDNSKDLVIFDSTGKVFRLPIHKIPFSDKSSIGMDIRMLLKKFSSNIISVMYMPFLDTLANNAMPKTYIVSITKNGLIKKIDIADIQVTTTSGVIYSKLNKEDYIVDVGLATDACEIIVYNQQKVLRISMNSVPYLKRATLGNISLKTDTPIEGMSILNTNILTLLVVTARGRIIRVPKEAIPLTVPNRAGTKMLKLPKDDGIISIIGCTPQSAIRIIHTDNSSVDLVAGNIALVNPGAELKTPTMSKDISRCQLIKL